MIGELTKTQMEFSIPHEGDNWKFKILRPSAKMERASLINEYLHGTPLVNVSSEDYNTAFIYSTLQLALVDNSGPKEFYSKYNGVFKEIEDFDYILGLYEKYDKKDIEFNNRKKKPGRNEGSKEEQVDNTRPPLQEL